MGVFDQTGDDELRARMDSLLERIQENLRQISPVLLAISRDRSEVENVLTELRRRGATEGGEKDAAP